MIGLDEVPCGYLAFDDDQNVLEVNAEFARMVGRPAETLLNVPLSDLLAPATRIFVRAYVVSALATQGVVREAYVTLLSSNAEEYATVMNAVRRHDGARNVNACVFLPMRRRRIFERELVEGRRMALASSRAEQVALAKLRAAQSQLAVQDQMASLGMLAAGVAHEINNPLTYVATNLELLAKSVEGDPERKEHCGALLSEATMGVTRIREIVDSLRTLSWVDPNRNAVVDVLEVVDVASRLAGNQIKRRAEFVVERDPPPLTARGDTGRLSQVVLNLLINAAQAFTEVKHGNKVWLRARRQGDQVTLEVEDNGPGIAIEIQSLIFDPFFTTKPVGLGTGLGLSICKSIITSLGGTISVHSIPGHGAAFVVALPFVSSAATTSTSSLQPLPLDATRLRVLAVDDDPHVTKVIKLALHEYDVEVINSATAALDWLRAGGAVDTILCDVLMPEVNGMELYQQVVRTRPELAHRFVFLTGGVNGAEAEAFFSSIPNRYLQKPFDLKELKKAVQAAAAAAYQPG